MNTQKEIKYKKRVKQNLNNVNNSKPWIFIFFTFCIMVITLPSAFHSTLPPLHK